MTGCTRVFHKIATFFIIFYRLTRLTAVVLLFLLFVCVPLTLKATGWGVLVGLGSVFYVFIFFLSMCFFKKAHICVHVLILM